MSPIFQNLKVNLGLKEKEKYAWPSMFALLFLIIFPFISGDLIDHIGLTVFLSWPLGFWIGGANLFGKIAQRNFEERFDDAYYQIESKTKELSKKKNLNTKQVDKIIKNLETDFFDYEDVLSILGFTEDCINHKNNLKKKVKYAVPDIKVTKKPREVLYFRTHVSWSQGSPDNNVFKDLGHLYLSNKRFVFIGFNKSYSINFSRITNVENGYDYFQVCKTAGKNDIFYLTNESSIKYLSFLFDEFN